MKKFIVDANVILRFLLRDNEKHYQIAADYISKAKGKKLQLIILPETILEIDYVLRGLYNFSRKKSAETLAKIARSPYLQVQRRNAVILALEKYKKINVELADIILFETAKQEKNTEVLSFDSDFKKIEKSKK